MSDWINNFDLNQTVTLCHVTESVNTYGAVTKTKTAYATINGAMWQMSASEQLYGDRIHTNSTHKLVIKPRTDILNSDVALIGGIYYLIDKPDDVLSYGDVMQIGLSLEDSGGGAI